MGVSLRVRRYESVDAKRCCDVINDAIMVMDGLNEAARARIRTNNVPERLGPDLERWVTMVVESPEGRVVGLGALVDDEVKRVYVDPDAHGRGVARALMSALEALAETRGLRSIRLDASPSSVEFYESLGYLAGQADSLEIGDASFRFVHMTRAYLSHRTIWAVSRANMCLIHDGGVRCDLLFEGVVMRGFAVAVRDP